jgi:hypothetical protein
MESDSQRQTRTKQLIDELWQLIQDSKRLVQETMRLAAEADRARRQMLADDDHHSQQPGSAEP